MSKPIKMSLSTPWIKGWYHGGLNYTCKEVIQIDARYVKWMQERGKIILDKEALQYLTVRLGKNKEKSLLGNKVNWKIM